MREVNTVGEYTICYDEQTKTFFAESHYNMFTFETYKEALAFFNRLMRDEKGNQ